MKRRNFLSLLGVAPLIPNLPPPVQCGFCREFGHKEQVSSTRWKSDGDSLMSFPCDMLTMHCINRPLNLDVIEVVRP